MLKYLLLNILFILFYDLSFGQTITIIESQKYKGAIFSHEYQSLSFVFPEQNKRFTPTLQEIEKFEYSLNVQLKHINKNLWNQGKDCPVIHKKTRKYIRQYLGFIDESGNKFLVVNFIWSTSSLHENPKDEYYNELGDWKKNWLVWFDGCSYYWNIKYYIESDTFFDLQINGSS